ncbi:hypothetical protein Q8F55_009079 [Vanrija albida]|uniref:Aminotransferase class I/classII large domain-containing protein n=1 Tax=Vanrija albida TaxID=181172 RepID=A0ABR3PSM2_9TREE
MSQLDNRLDGLLELRKAKGRFRRLREYDTSRGSGLTDFSSNDYLSLTTSDELRADYLKRLNDTDVILGSTGSRLLSGCTPAHSHLENRLCDHFGAPAALLFNSGWDANVSFFGFVPQPGDWVVFDELVHASVHSGMRGSRVPSARRLQFAHNDPESLAAVLRKIAAQPSSSAAPPTVFLALEALYSMDGDFAPIPTLLDVFDQHVPREQQCVIVDEAHTTGVYGSQGRGIVHQLKEGAGRDDGRVTVRLMTFGKGVGCSGSVLLASDTVRSFLINFARPFIFSTALPVSTVLALESAWDLLSSEGGQRKRDDLAAIVAYFQELLAPVLARTPPELLRLPDPTPTPFPGAPEGLSAHPHSPIHGLLSPTPHALSAFLLARGFIVRPVVPPTVPPGGERVRVCLRAGHSREEIAALVSAVAEWVDSGTAEAEAAKAGRPLRARL